MGWDSGTVAKGVISPVSMVLLKNPNLPRAEVGDSNRESLPRSPIQTDSTAEGSQAQPLTRLIFPYR